MRKTETSAYILSSFNASEHVAMMNVTAARQALSSAIESFEAAGYGSHVTNPLREALRFVEFSISEVK